MSRNNDYRRENLLNHQYHRNYYKRIGIDLSRLINTTIPWKINFTEKSEENEGAIFVVVVVDFCEKSAKYLFKILFRFITCHKIIKII